jgi:UDP-3-O-[3-hydroxymyristoyl] glucosamine N-acyltransferase
VTSRTYKLKELAEMVGGEMHGDGEVDIQGVAGIKEADIGDLTFLSNPKYEPFLETTNASAIISPPGTKCNKPLLWNANPYLAFLHVLTLFAEDITTRYARGIHESAVIHAQAKLGDNVSIGPHCVVEKGARVGKNVTMIFGAYVGEDVEVGDDCLLYPQVTVRERCSIGDRVILHPGVVIGADGFGFAKNGATHQKVPQIGRVIIEDDVEIGANSTVDRATTGITRICRGSKIDNLVQIAHNVVVGENSIIAAQVGISGSTELGKNVVLAGQAGLVGHITIGDNAMVGAQGGVTKSIPPAMKVSGYPAREHSLAKRLYAYTAKLPDIYERLKQLEKKIEGLEKGNSIDKATKDDS